MDLARPVISVKAEGTGVVGRLGVDDIVGGGMARRAAESNVTMERIRASVSTLILDQDVKGHARSGVTAGDTVRGHGRRRGQGSWQATRSRAMATRPGPGWIKTLSEPDYPINPAPLLVNPGRPKVESVELIGPVG